MKNYVLNGQGNGKKAIFYYNVILFALFVFIYGLIMQFGESFMSQFNVEKLNVSGRDVSAIIGVIIGFGLVFVTFNWAITCIIAWITSLFVTSKLEKPQRKRYAAMYYIIFSIISALSTPLTIYVDPNIYSLCVIVLYFVFLKVFDRKLVR